MSRRRSRISIIDGKYVISAEQHVDPEYLYFSDILGQEYENKYHIAKQLEKNLRRKSSTHSLYSNANITRKSSFADLQRLVEQSLPPDYKCLYEQYKESSIDYPILSKRNSMASLNLLQRSQSSTMLSDDSNTFEKNKKEVEELLEQIPNIVTDTGKKQLVYRLHSLIEKQKLHHEQLKAVAGASTVTVNLDQDDDEFKKPNRFLRIINRISRRSSGTPKFLLYKKKSSSDLVQSPSFYNNIYLEGNSRHKLTKSISSAKGSSANSLYCNDDTELESIKLKHHYDPHIVPTSVALSPVSTRNSIRSSHHGASRSSITSPETSPVLAPVALPNSPAVPEMDLYKTYPKQHHYHRLSTSKSIEHDEIMERLSKEGSSSNSLLEAKTTPASTVAAPTAMPPAYSKKLEKKIIDLHRICVAETRDQLYDDSLKSYSNRTHKSNNNYNPSRRLSKITSTEEKVYVDEELIEIFNGLKSQTLNELPYMRITSNFHEQNPAKPAESLSAITASTSTPSIALETNKWISKPVFSSVSIEQASKHNSRQSSRMSSNFASNSTIISGPPSDSDMSETSRFSSSSSITQNTKTFRRSKLSAEMIN